jgi:hypothetical protein
MKVPCACSAGGCDFITADGPWLICLVSGARKAKHVREVASMLDASKTEKRAATAPQMASGPQQEEFSPQRTDPGRSSVERRAWTITCSSQEFWAGDGAFSRAELQLTAPSCCTASCHRRTAMRARLGIALNASYQTMSHRVSQRGPRTAGRGPATWGELWDGSG